MKPDHLQELAELEDTYWWHVAKQQLITSLLAKFAPSARTVGRRWHWLIPQSAGVL